MLKINILYDYLLYFIGACEFLIDICYYVYRPNTKDVRKKIKK